MRGTGKTTSCNPATRKGRRDKAQEFVRSAEIIDGFADTDGDLIDAFITLCVHAGIAAGDTICCTRLGRYSTSTDHADACALLRTVDAKLGDHLETLIRLKSRSAYGGPPSTPSDRKRAKRAVNALMSAMESL